MLHSLVIGLVLNEILGEQPSACDPLIGLNVERARFEAYVVGGYSSTWPEAEEGWDKVQGPTGLGEGGKTSSLSLLTQEDLLEEGGRSVQFFHAWHLAEGGSSMVLGLLVLAGAAGTEKPTRPVRAPPG